MSKGLLSRSTGYALASAVAIGIFAPQLAVAAQRIETVVVTAEKRSENIQAIPAAITAVSADQLTQQGIRQPTDLNRVVPSLSESQLPGSSTAVSFDIRGQVASDILLNISQSVGLYEDGGNIPHPEGTQAAFFDLQRVEVLRGPQGTLYGRNTTGGAINLITQGADFDGYHGFGSAEVGNFEDWKLSGAVNIPIVDDKLAVRLAYQHWNREGFGKSAVTHQRLGAPHDDDIGRISILYTPTSSLTVDLRGEITNLNETGPLGVADAQPLQANALTGTLTNFNSNALVGTLNALEAYMENGGTAPLDFTPGNPCLVFSCAAITTGLNQINAAIASSNLFTNQSAVHQYERVRTYHATANIIWNVTDNFQIKSITAYHHLMDFHNFDLSGLPYYTGITGVGAGQPPIGFVPFNAGPEEADDFYSQEFDLSGTAYNDRVHWLFGAFLSDDEGRGQQPVMSNPLILSVFSTFASPSPLSFLYSPEAVSNAEQKSVSDKSWAIFTQDDIKLLDKLTLTVGGRYTEDVLTQNLSYYVYDASPYVGIDPNAGMYVCANGAGTPTPTSTPCDQHQRAKFTGYSYLLSLNYQFTNDIMGYVKMAQGYRGGALQGRVIGAVAAAKPEIARDFELGMKGDFFDRHLRTNMDVYQTIYTGKQVTQIFITQVGAITFPQTPIINAGKAVIRGFEGEFVALPLDGVTLSGTLTYIDGTYRNFGQNCNNPLLATNCNVTESGVPFDAVGTSIGEPKWRYSISARYDMPLWNGDLGIEGDWAWHSPTPYTPASYNQDFAAYAKKNLYGAVGILNARVDYELPESGWTVSVFSTNLLDKHYQVATLSDFAGGVVVGETQEPRMYGLQIRKTFGGGP